MTSRPSKENRFFLYDPEGDGISFFPTAKERDEYAAKIIPDYCDDTWSEEVEFVIAGEVTHTAQEVDRVDRPPEDQLDENGCDQEGEYWPHGWDWRCNYVLKPIK